MQVRINQFCGLSRNKKWKNWLKSAAPDLEESLTGMQKEGASCKKNTNRMIEIYNELLKRGKGEDLELFLSKEFPAILVKKTELRRGKQRKAPLNKYKNIREANKHGVFAHYDPKILTFPQKRIIIDPDTVSLEKKVRSFISDKLNADYIMIEDRAYIEFFLPKYRKEAREFPSYMREIEKWRKENMS